jgi:hypothetical protein
MDAGGGFVVLLTVWSIKQGDRRLRSTQLS